LAFARRGFRSAVWDGVIRKEWAKIQRRRSNQPRIYILSCFWRITKTADYLLLMSLHHMLLQPYEVSLISLAR